MRLISFCALFAAMMLFFSCERDGDKRELEKKIFKAEKRDLVEEVSFSGQITPRKKVLIRPPYAGFVRKVFVKVGDEVKVNEPLVSVSQSMFDTNSSYPIRSPIDGVVTQINKAEGEEIEKSSDDANFILRVDTMKNFLIETKLSETDVLKVKVGQEANVTINAMSGVDFKARVFSIAQSPMAQEGWRNEGKVEFAVLLALEEKENEKHKEDDKILPGLGALVSITSAKKDNVLSIPLETILNEDRKNFVFDKEGKRKEIRLGLVNDEWAEVVSGLKEGDEVVALDYLELSKNEKKD